MTSTGNCAAAQPEWLADLLRHVAKLKLELKQFGEALNAAERARERGAFMPDPSFDPVSSRYFEVR